MSDLIIDANVIRNIAQGNRDAAEALAKLLKSGRRVYVARAAWNELSEEYRVLLKELGIGFSPASVEKGMLTVRGNVYADNVVQTPKPSKGIPGPMPEYGGLKDPITGLKSRPADAFVGAETKSLNAELWTLDKQFARQARQQGIQIASESSIASVGGAETVAEARVLLRPVLPSAVPPAASGLKLRLMGAKAGFKAGLIDAFSAENIASMIPEAILVIADKVAARDAIRNIETKFIKEGFAKGFAAGLMAWTEEEVGARLLNRVTVFRLNGLEDPAGFLDLTFMFKVAEAYENYAVYIGYQTSFPRAKAWKDEWRRKGFANFLDMNYQFPQNNDDFFEYDFIDKFAFSIHRWTDALIEPAIHFH